MTSHKHYGVSNYLRLDCLFYSKKTSKLHITAPLWGNPPEFLTKRPAMWKVFPHFDDNIWKKYDGSLKGHIILIRIRRVWYSCWLIVLLQSNELTRIPNDVHYTTYRKVHWQLRASKWLLNNCHGVDHQCSHESLSLMKRFLFCQWAVSMQHTHCVLHGEPRCFHMTSALKMPRHFVRSRLSFWMKHHGTKNSYTKLVTAIQT